MSPTYMAFAATGINRVELISDLVALNSDVLMATQYEHGAASRLSVGLDGTNSATYSYDVVVNINYRPHNNQARMLAPLEDRVITAFFSLSY